jgi:cytochrome b
MNAEPIRHVPIWSCWHRATHWLIACGVLFELFSGKRYFMSIASKGSRSGC